MHLNFTLSNLTNRTDLDFIDEETIIVANRSGDAIFLQLPSGGMISDSLELTPLGVISSGSAGLLRGQPLFRSSERIRSYTRR